MTTGANARVAYLHEPAGSYMGAPTDSDYKTFGNDATISDLSFENALERMGEPGTAEAVEHVAQQFEGAIGISGKLGNPWWHNHLFGGAPTASGTAAPYSYDWTIDTGEVQSARVYAGINYAGGTTERELKGVIFSQLQVSCNIGETVRFQLTGFYGDEVPNSTLTPGTQPSEQATTLTFHGGDLQIPNSTSLARMQSCTLSINTQARPQPQWDRHPAAGVMGATQTTLSPEKVIQNSDMLDLAYGSTSGPASTVDGAASATLDFTSNTDTRMRYDLSGATPGTYGWPDHGNPEQDALENIELSVDSVTAHAESSQSSAR